MFNDCVLDLKRHAFSKGDLAVRLEPQVFELLALFASHPNELITKDRILSEVWHGRIVSEAALSSRINAVRRAIGDSGQTQSMLRTVPRLGFEFIAPVTTAQTELGTMPVQDGAAAQTVRMAMSGDQTRIAFAATGQGPPLLRAGHFLTHLEHDWRSPVWQPLLEHFGQYFRFVRYDQRATGLSDPNPPSLELDALVDDLRAVADAAGLDKFPIFAASQGVPVTVAFAARYPERVSKIVLYGGYAQGRSMRGTSAESENAEAIRTVIKTGWGKSGSAFASAFTTLYMPDASQEQIAHITELQLASATPENAVALRTAIDQFDVTDLLEQVQAPTLILHAREDSVHPYEQSCVLAAGIPNAKLRIVEGRNHMPIWQSESWQEIMKAMMAFLT